MAKLSGYSPRLVWVVLLVGALLSVLAFGMAANFERRVAEAGIVAEQTQRALLIRNQFETVASTLEDLGSLYAVSDVVAGDAFSRFVRPILNREPAFEALSWNPIVTDAERSQHVASMRAAGLAGYRITERAADGELVAAARRERHVVVAFVEPLSGNESAVGFDVYSEATRREALDRARDTGELAVAAPLRLVQSSGESTGVLAFLPRYRVPTLPASIAERRMHLAGYLVAVVDMPRLVAEALAGLGPPAGTLTITTAPAGSEPALLYGSSQEVAAVTRPLGIGAQPPHYVHDFSWGGHAVSLRFDAAADALVAARTWIPLVLLLAGLLITGLVAKIISEYGGRARAVAMEVAHRTNELSEANQELHAEVERRKTAEARLAQSQKNLEQEVARRTSQLRATSNQLRSILESEPECVKSVAADGSLEDMNAAGLGMIEADSMGEVQGADVYSLISDEHRDAFIDMNRRVIAGERATLEFQIVGLKGTRRWVETHAAPLVDPNGGPTRHLAITRDITARKAAQEEHERLESQLRHAQKLESIGVLAGGIAHDFNNLLQVVTGNSEIVLQDKNLSPGARASIEAGYDAATHAAKLCDQMLTYAGQSRPDFKPIDLTQLTVSMVDLLKTSAAKNTRFALHVEDDARFIRGDDSQLRQILMNLITNASEAIGDASGEIEVRIEGRAIDAPTRAEDWIGQPPPAGTYVALQVSDTGCGIDAETLERMFDPFFTTKFTGRGLGLSATLGIIQSHEAYLSVTSRPGAGTTITALFPLATDIGQPEPVAATVSAERLGATVLVVDDEPSVLQVGAMMLEGMGCEVITARDGAEAVDRFREDPGCVDAVVLDVTMPTLDGNETCAVLRRLRPDVPVIFCSGYADDAVDNANGSGAYTGFLHKPYRRDELAAILAEALAAARSTSHDDLKTAEAPS